LIVQFSFDLQSITSIFSIWFSCKHYIWFVSNKFRKLSAVKRKINFSAYFRFDFIKEATVVGLTYEIFKIKSKIEDSNILENINHALKNDTYIAFTFKI